MIGDFVIVGIVAAVTILIRFLPFWVFGGKRQTPAYISYLGKVLPYSIMGMLVVYCLRNVTIKAAPHGLPELISCGLIVILHRLKRNTLLSIVGGTACYMLLTHFVFI